jgi:Flagellar assembly protein FliH
LAAVTVALVGFFTSLILRLTAPTACCRPLVAAPHVVVRVNDGLHQTARQELDKTKHACGFGSCLMVLAAPDITPGDCRIEWTGGGEIEHRARAELGQFTDFQARRDHDGNHRGGAKLTCSA